MEDVPQQATVPRAEEHRVVRQVGPAAVGAEVDEEQGHRPVHAPQPRCRPPARRDAGVEPGVGVVEVGVRDHDVERLARQGVGGDQVARPVARLDLDAPDRRVEPQLAAEVHEELRQGTHEGPGTAAREEDAPVPLEEVDQRVDGARLERVAADQQGVEAQRLAQALVAHEAGDRVDRPNGRHAGGRARAATRSHVSQVQERLCREALVAGREHAPAVLVEAPVARDVAGRATRDLGEQRGRVAAIVEAVAVAPLQAVEGVDRQQVDRVRQPAARDGEELLEASAAR